jgi:hypothetical protein
MKRRRTAAQGSHRKVRTLFFCRILRPRTAIR